METEYRIVQTFTVPSTDLFAYRLTFQLKPFVYWMPNLEAAFIDAFSLDWAKFTFHAFHPFGLVSRVLQKVVDDHSRSSQDHIRWAGKLQLMACHLCGSR